MNHSKACVVGPEAPPQYTMPHMLAQLKNILRVGLCVCVQQGAAPEVVDHVSLQLVDSLFNQAGIDASLIDRAKVARAVSPVPGVVSTASGSFAVSVSWRGAEPDQPRAVARALERAEMLWASEACMKSAEVTRCMADGGFDDPAGARAALQEALGLPGPDSGCVIPGVLAHATTLQGRVAGVAVLDVACLRARLASPSVRAAVVKAYHESLGGRAAGLVKLSRAAEALKLLDEARSVAELPSRWRFVEVLASHSVGDQQRLAREMRVLLADSEIRGSGLGIEDFFELFRFSTELKDEALEAQTYSLALWSLGFDSSANIRAGDFFPSETTATPHSAVESRTK